MNMIFSFVILIFLLVEKFYYESDLVVLNGSEWWLIQREINILRSLEIIIIIIIIMVIFKCYFSGELIALS